MFRFVHVTDVHDPNLAGQFRSDRVNGMVPYFRREKRYPELLDGMSAYDSLATATARWNQCRAIAIERNEPIQIGSFIAEVRLTPSSGFSVEDLAEPDGHLTIWGDPSHLAAATSRIHTPEVEDR